MLFKFNIFLGALDVNSVDKPIPELFCTMDNAQELSRITENVPELSPSKDNVLDMNTVARYRMNVQEVSWTLWLRGALLYSTGNVQVVSMDVPWMINEEGDQ